MLYPFRFHPVYKNYIWGGRALADLGKRLPSSGIVAESWEISGHQNGCSIIANGHLTGASLQEAVRACGRALLGSILPENDTAGFPLLVKLIDARERLSVQVHPGEAFAGAHENGEHGKNEMWYVVAARPGASLIAGVLPGVGPGRFAEAIRSGTCLELLQTVPVRAGDAINIPAGLVHAIGDGLVICEIQQNSDTTYRIYDYDRRDASGQARPLHIDKALAVIDFAAAVRSPLIGGLFFEQEGLIRRVLVLNRYFLVEEQRISGQADFLADGRRFRTLTVLKGHGSLIYKTAGGAAASEFLRPGDSLLVPAQLGRWQVRGDLLMIVSQPADFLADAQALAAAAGSRTKAPATGRPAVDWLQHLAEDGMIALEPLPDSF